MKIVTHIETMKQALDALEDSVPDSSELVGDYIAKYGECFRPARLAAMRKTVSDGEAAITALRAAIAQPESESAAPVYVPLSDSDIRTEFAKLYPSDDAMLHLSEHNRDYAVESIGARHHWTAFKAGARAIERAVRGNQS